MGRVRPAPGADAGSGCGDRPSGVPQVEGLAPVRPGSGRHPPRWGATKRRAGPWPQAGNHRRYRVRSLHPPTSRRQWCHRGRRAPASTRCRERRPAVVPLELDGRFVSFYDSDRLTNCHLVAGLLQPLRDEHVLGRHSRSRDKDLFHSRLSHSKHLLTSCGLTRRAAGVCDHCHRVPRTTTLPCSMWLERAGYGVPHRPAGQ